MNIPLYRCQDNPNPKGKHRNIVSNKQKNDLKSKKNQSNQGYQKSCLGQNTS